MSRRGLGPMDEYPIHQLPQPIAWPGNSDRNFYDRAYLNAHDRSGTIFLITGIGYYPNLGVKDAFVLIRRRNPDGTDTQTAVHLSDAIDDNRLEQRVGNYRLSIENPLRALHLTLDETEGIALDLHWEGLFDALLEQPHVMRQGAKVTLDAQRFAQVGSWRGSITVDGEHIVVDNMQTVSGSAPEPQSSPQKRRTRPRPGPSCTLSKQQLNGPILGVGRHFAGTSSCLATKSFNAAMAASISAANTDTSSPRSSAIARACSSENQCSWNSVRQLEGKLGTHNNSPSSTSSSRFSEIL